MNEPAPDIVEVNSIEIELLRSGAGRPLLFLHAHLGIARSDEFLLRLSDAFEVFAPSHPGFDRSEITPDITSVDDLAYFYLDFIEQANLRDLILVGASFGGWIALEMAVRSSERIGELVLVDSVGVKFGTAEDGEIADVFSLSEEDFASLAYKDASHGVTDYEALSDDQLLAIARNREAIARFAWLPCLYNPKLLPWLHRVKVPTLVLWGADDRIVPPDYGRKLSTSLPSAQFAEIGKAGHFPQIERPAETAAAIRAFVTQTTEHAGRSRALAGKS